MAEVLVHQGDYILIRQMDGDFIITQTMDGEFGRYMAVETAEVYDGPTEVTPTESTQVLYTTGLVVPENITVNPIPTNYGLITWNGSVITVS